MSDNRQKLNEWTLTINDTVLKFASEVNAKDFYLTSEKVLGDYRYELDTIQMRNNIERDMTIELSKLETNNAYCTGFSGGFIYCPYIPVTDVEEDATDQLDFKIL
jgi:hypothetical protein